MFFGPDTYRFAHAVLDGLGRQRAPVRRVVDIGCGAGPGVILVACSYVEAEAIGGDINYAALRLARVNAEAAKGYECDIPAQRSVQDVAGQFDVILCNSP